MQLSTPALFGGAAFLLFLGGMILIVHIVNTGRHHRQGNVTFLGVIAALYIGYGVLLLFATFMPRA